MPRSLKNEVLRYIVLAQIASDSGKHILSNEFERIINHEKAEILGYSAKPYYILKAIQLLNKSKNIGINYYIEYGLDQNSYTSIIVYFDIKSGIIDGVNERHQISFHNPYDTCPYELKKMAGSGRKTRWTKKIGESKWLAIQIAKSLERG